MDTPQDEIKVTSQEIRILTMLTEGRRYKEIASSMGLAEQTIKWYVMRLRDKFNCSTTSELIHMVTESGLLKNDITKKTGI